MKSNEFFTDEMHWDIYLFPEGLSSMSITSTQAQSNHIKMVISKPKVKNVLRWKRVSVFS